MKAAKDSSGTKSKTKQLSAFIITIKERGCVIPKELVDIVHDYIPIPREEVHIDIHSYLSIANAIRRTLLNELPVKVLTTKLSDVDTDCSIPSDMIITRLEMIPIHQDANLSGSFATKNIGNTVTAIFNTSLKLYKTGGSEYKFEDVYTLAKLRPGKTLKINNIHTETRYGGVAIPIENMVYKELIPNKHYSISFSTVGIYEAKELLDILFANLKSRLLRVQTFLELSDEILITDEFEYSKEAGNHNRLLIIGERYTIGNILVQFGYLHDPSIINISASPTHATENNIVVNWVHPNNSAFMIEAIKHAISIFP